MRRDRRDASSTPRSSVVLGGLPFQHEHGADRNVLQPIVRRRRVPDDDAVAVPQTSAALVAGINPVSRNHQLVHRTSRIEMWRPRLAAVPGARHPLPVSTFAREPGVRRRRSWCARRHWTRFAGRSAPSVPARASILPTDSRGDAHGPRPAAMLPPAVWRDARGSGGVAVGAARTDYEVAIVDQRTMAVATTASRVISGARHQRRAWLLESAGVDRPSAPCSTGTSCCAPGPGAAWSWRAVRHRRDQSSCQKRRQIGRRCLEHTVEQLRPSCTQ